MGLPQRREGEEEGEAEEWVVEMLRECVLTVHIEVICFTRDLDRCRQEGRKVENLRFKTVIYMYIHTAVISGAECSVSKPINS